jgi:hypothetical protein
MSSWPRSSTTRTWLSSRARDSAALMARYMSEVMAFFFSRRLISMVTMPSLLSTRMLGWLIGLEAFRWHR